ncbi:MAG TPA: hypothetical protein VF595_00705 [Tepidisphaeraceae bacterium]|jgi:tetratricopeptide (TPR) repeat protein
MGRRDRKNESNAAVVVGVALFAAVAAAVLIYSVTGNPTAVAPPANAYEPNVEANAAAGVTPYDGHLTGNMHTPGTLLAARKTRLPELEAWAKAWEAAHANKADTIYTSDDDAARLRELVEKSDLTAIECFHISKLVSDQKDLPAAEAWMNPGVTRAEAEIGHKAHDDPSVNPVLNAMGDATQSLWARGPKIAKLLERTTAMGIKFDRTAPWSQRPEWSRLGHAEALYLQERYDEALREIDTFLADVGTESGKFIKKEQKAEAHWAKALVLLARKQEVEAIPELQAVVAIPTHHHINDASDKIFELYCRYHRSTEAQAILEEIRRRNTKSDSELATMVAMVDNAKYDEEYRKLNSANVKTPLTR